MIKATSTTFRLKLFLLATVAATLNTSFTSPWRSKHSAFSAIVIDAGHGGADQGSSGRISKEKNVTLKVALKLGKAINERFPGVKVYYTRTSDVFIPLYQRIEIANKRKAALFISIHCNSMPSGSARRTTTKGTETFVSGFGRLREQSVAIRENASILLEKNYKENYDGYDPRDPESLIIFSLIKSTNRLQSIKLGSFLEKEYRRSGRLSRGVKEQSLAVLAKAGLPAVLTEIGFISHPQEERFINSEAGQTEIVANILDGIASYKEDID